MDGMCARCARLTLAQAKPCRVPRVVGVRSFTSTSQIREDQPSSSHGPSTPRQGPPKLVIRRQVVDDSRSSNPNSPSARRTGPPQGGQVLRRATPGQAFGQSSGPVLRRTGTPQTGSSFRRTGPSGSSQGGRPSGGSRGRGPPKPDKRRRRAKSEDEDDGRMDAAAEAEMNRFVDQHVHPPYNPTEHITYNPQNLTLDDFKADWPNTAMTNSGLTESVVQKVEWLARRLPHGYQTPEQVAEHYLKGNLTRFESEEEKQIVLKLASERSAQSEKELKDGTLKFPQMMKTSRFPAVKDSTFTSVASQQENKAGLMQSGVHGGYATEEKHKYAFMQSAARLLNNNESYGPASAKRLLDRVQSLIPPGRQAGAQQVKPVQ